ncbi:hypothetical protein CACET_c27010 [Clostridium aceticum]|uniref:Uncharacterized protein n=1 Tax=Clostridium aceticum TaxID=84022 RepID=A0A0D8I8F7_9CLOT|nr:hypothetical protein [Clostridium aceticum]AKL96146.1 hypothetical protein CACET_c27010 [Clostridium aceticum]KJF26570.1 hypothetical protein TZ02_11880 [Clostridium aceticum]
MKKIANYSFKINNKSITVNVLNSDRETYLDNKTMADIVMIHTRNILENINDDITINKDNDNLTISIEQVNENTINVNILAAMTNDCIFDTDEL